MKRDLICIIGAVLGLITGVARGSGGVILMSGSSQDKILGIGLITVGLLLILSAIMLILKRTSARKKILTIGIILFLIDGIINGFVLFGRPQLSGQIVNFTLALIILICLWTTPIGKKSDS